MEMRKMEIMEMEKERKKKRDKKGRREHLINRFTIRN